MSSKWIWPFELLEKLGEGGMGVVYRARYVGNDRIVAIKLLPEEVAKNPTICARFDRELEILTQLRHPNIVHCFGGTTESKQRYYAMELVEGGTLGELLRTKGSFTWDHVVEYGIQMCAALQYAHDKGVIHRDIKPGNFLITKSGKLKLSDFGLATIVAGQRLTTAGKTAGTFLYMAPEQIRGRPPLSNRTDLYALGCVLFELLTGKPPFDAEAPAGVLHKHLKEPPPRVSSQLMNCPPELDRLVNDLLQKDPELRPASAAEVERRLHAILRPSLSQVDPFAHTPAASMIQVTTPTSDDDLATDTVPLPTLAQSRRQWTALILVSLLAGWGWWSAYAASQLAQQYAQTWITAAQAAGPGQIPALERLADLPRLPTEVPELLIATAESTAPTDVRVAALKTLALRPAECQQFVHRLTRLGRDEADVLVRQQAEQTRQVLQSFKTPPSRPLWQWFLGFMGIASLGAAAYWYWYRPGESRATSTEPKAVAAPQLSKAAR